MSLVFSKVSFERDLRTTSQIQISGSGKVPMERATCFPSGEILGYAYEFGGVPSGYSFPCRSTHTRVMSCVFVMTIGNITGPAIGVPLPHVVVLRKDGADKLTAPQIR